MGSKKYRITLNKVGKSAINLVIVAAFLSPSIRAPYAHAYIGCEPVAGGITATRTDDNHITYHNTSPYCVFVGLAMYKLSSSDTTKREFHYATMRGLPGGGSYTIAMPIPPCAYLVDVIVGEPIKDAKVASAYGNRLIFEYVMADHTTRYCEGESLNRVPQQQPVAHVSQPAPTPRASTAPLPSPRPTSMPLPLPKVLGAATSTNPLAANTGGDATIPFALLGSMAASGVSWYIRRR